MTEPASDLHPHLLRQLRGVGASLDDPPTPQQWRDLLKRVSENYDDEDRERRLQDHAWEVSSTELLDLSTRLAAASASDLALEHGRLTTVLETTSTGICLIDATNTIVEINHAGAAFMRSDRNTAMGSNAIDLLWPEQRREEDSIPNDLRVAICGRSHWTTPSVRLRLSETQTTTCSIVFTPLAPVSGGDSGGLIAFHDLTAQQRAAEDEAWRASHDPLTGLLNRAAVTTHIDSALKSNSNRELQQALLFIDLDFTDLDRFKSINDTSGLDVGDAVLVESAERICNVVRTNDVVARPGGDKFIVFVENIPGNETVQSVADRVLDSLRLPFRVSGQLLHLSGNIGYTVARGLDDTAVALLRDSAIALDRAKAVGRYKAVAFGEDQRESVESRVALDRQLRAAVANRDLTVAFQPIIDMRNDRIVGFETLSRWPTSNGPIGPDTFIPLAEENGLISNIGEMALNEAVSLAAEVGAHGGHWPQFGQVFAVNVSGVQLASAGFAALVERTLADAHIDANVLMVELTESTLMTHGDKALSELKTLRHMGVHVALDDFGTGWSSLSMLQHFPIDCIKIDRSFVSSMTTDSDDHAIVQAVVELGRTLGHSVIAEGVETSEQAEALILLGCSLAQGYLYARPAGRAQALENTSASHTA